MATNRQKPRTYSGESAEKTATIYMRIMNTAFRLADNKTDLMVLVEGPDDGDWTVMDIRDAIEHEFAYTWEV